MEKYIKPEVEVTTFATVDVITTSGATGPITKPPTGDDPISAEVTDEES